MKTKFKNIDRDKRQIFRTIALSRIRELNAGYKDIAVALERAGTRLTKCDRGKQLQLSPITCLVFIGKHSDPYPRKIYIDFTDHNAKGIELDVSKEEFARALYWHFRELEKQAN